MELEAKIWINNLVSDVDVVVILKEGRRKDRVGIRFKKIYKKNKKAEKLHEILSERSLRFPPKEGF